MSRKHDRRRSRQSSDYRKIILLPINSYHKSESAQLQRGTAIMKILRKFISAAAALSLISAAVPLYAYSAMSAESPIYVSADSPAVLSDDVPSFSDTVKAGEYFRTALKSRKTSISLILPKTGNPLSVTVNSLLDTALKETGAANEGDYLRLAIASYSCNSLSSSSRTQLNFTFKYHADAEKEKAVDTKVSEVIKSLDLGGKSDYQKTKAIYDYIASNVDYADGVNDTDLYSAYGALINNEAVCQGYSQLLYRLLSEAGVRNRVVEGTSEGVNHAWNLADIDGSCYLMDVTWDSTFNGKAFHYFLKGSSDFDSYTSMQTHTTGSGDPEHSAMYPDYTAESFTSLYPLSKTAYDPTAFTLGDVDADGKITSSDAAVVLEAYARASGSNDTGLTSLQRSAADVNENDKIDAVDAACILRYYALSSSGQDVDISDIAKEN